MRGEDKEGRLAGALSSSQNSAIMLSGITLGVRALFLLFAIAVLSLSGSFMSHGNNGSVPTATVKSVFAGAFGILVAALVRFRPPVVWVPSGSIPSPSTYYVARSLDDEEEGLCFLMMKGRGWVS